MNGEFKPGGGIHDEEEFVVIPIGATGYTIDYATEDEIFFEKIIVWGDERLRDRIIELLNRHGEKD